MIKKGHQNIFLSDAMKIISGQRSDEGNKYFG